MRIRLGFVVIILSDITKAKRTLIFLSTPVSFLSYRGALLAVTFNKGAKQN